MPNSIDPTMPDAPAPVVGPNGRAGVKGPRSEATITWRTRGTTAEATYTLDPVPALPDLELAAMIGFALVQLRKGLAAHDITLTFAAEHPLSQLDQMAEEAATTAGFEGRRELLLLRRSLPVPPDDRARDGVEPAATRPFRPGVDDDAWLRVNNRSFAQHPDQGHETAATLAARTAESWFDPADFRVLDDPDRPGELAGFCWTKVHPGSAGGPRLGEIYVIGVDPDHHGRGLGSALVLAGLDHLATRGVTTAMLYVDADNTPARDLYDRLGFQVRRRRVVYLP